MISVERQVEHWREGARDDWEAAELLCRAGKTRQGLFFAHLALEKALKAHVCRATEDMAPRIHNLVRLAELAALELPRRHLEGLAKMNAFNLEGRYPETLPAPPDAETTRERLRSAREVLEWLNERL